MKVQNTRVKILDTARELVQTRSFHGFSFQDIADSIGVRKPSLYHHFASKDTLAIELLKEYRAQFQAFIHQVQHQSPADQLERYFAVFSDFLQAGQRICPGAAFVAGWSSISDRVKDEVNALVNQHQRWLTKLIRQGRERGELRDSLSSPEDQALWIYATLQGGLLMARVSGEQADFIRVIDQLKLMIIRS